MVTLAFHPAFRLAEAILTRPSANLWIASATGAALSLPRMDCDVESDNLKKKKNEQARNNLRGNDPAHKANRAFQG